MTENTWPCGEGETAAQVRTFDWAGTQLGPSALWPQRLRALVEVMLRNPVAEALLWGPDGVMIYNDAYAAICGARHPALLGMPVREAWPEAADFNGAVLAACHAGREQVYRETRLVLERHGLPQESWFDLFYTPVCGDDGRVEGVLAAIIEITQQVQARRVRDAHEEELRRVNRELDEQRARLEAANRQLAGDMAFLNELFRRSPSFIAVLIGPGHRFELTNDSYDRLIQHRKVHGKFVREALPEVAGQGFIDLLDSVYRSGEAFRGQKVQVMLDCGEGQGLEPRILDFVYQPLKDAHGLTYGIFVEGTDVTEHALAEERLRVAQDAGEIGTFEWYPGIGELVVSDSYRRVFGIAPGVRVDDALMMSLVVPEYHAYSGVHRLGRVPNPLEYAEFPIRRRDNGELRWVARRGQLVGDSQQGARYLGVAYDITDRKEAEQALRELNDSLERRVSSEVAERIKAENALRQAQKMEAVGQLASGVAHDFNNVLQIISSNLQLMERDPRPGQLQARLKTALSAVERGSKLSYQLLAFARRQPLLPVVTDLGALLRNIEPLLQRALGDQVLLVIDVERQLWSTAVDPNQMENALLNLVINARDAMHGSGTLAVTARNLPRGAGHVALSIADTGCGMSPEVQAKVFEPFYTTKEPGKGTGLGMSMVYGFVKQSGGEIAIDSTPGGGTTITIELPRADGLRAADSEEAPAEIPRGSETILVVEDDPAVRAAVVEMLRGLGYQVLMAGDGEAALVVLRAGASVDLVFSDVSMPGSVDCAALVRQVRVLAPHAAVLLTSGHAIERSLLDGAIADEVELLPKPYRLPQLAQAIRHELARKREQQRAPQAAAPIIPALSFLVVEDDRDTRELACEMLNALGHRAHGADGPETALGLLRMSRFDVLFTVQNMPSMTGEELAARAAEFTPGLRVILSSGEGHLPLDSSIALLPKPYDLFQLQAAISSMSRAPAPMR